jgi:hypothetical protein
MNNINNMNNMNNMNNINYNINNMNKEYIIKSPITSYGIINLKLNSKSNFYNEYNKIINDIKK